MKTAVLQLFSELFSEAGEVGTVQTVLSPRFTLFVCCLTASQQTLWTSTLAQRVSSSFLPLCLRQALARLSPITFVVRRVLCPVVLLNCTETRILLPVVFRAVLSTYALRADCFACRVSVVCLRACVMRSPDCVSSLWSRLRSALKNELSVMAFVLLLR